MSINMVLMKTKPRFLRLIHAIESSYITMQECLKFGRPLLARINYFGILLLFYMPQYKEVAYSYACSISCFPVETGW